MNKFFTICFLSFFMMTGSLAAACKVTHQFEGLIFDAGAFSSDGDMETYLDRAIKAGSEKIVLYPKLDAIPPDELEEIFPDQVVQGMDPWSNVAPIIWTETMDQKDIVSFYDRMKEDPDQIYLISGPSRFPEINFNEWLSELPNLWIGYGPDEFRLIRQNCGKGPWAKMITQSNGRIVFTSMGMDRTWSIYPWLIRDVKKAIGYLSPSEADALMFRNAENLYNLAVNAP